MDVIWPKTWLRLASEMEMGSTCTCMAFPKCMIQLLTWQCLTDLSSLYHAPACMLVLQTGRLGCPLPKELEPVWFGCGAVPEDISPRYVAGCSWLADKVAELWMVWYGCNAFTGDISSRYAPDCKVRS